MAAPAASYAKNCSENGGLIFLGKTADSSRSVWLSGTGAGSFELQAPGNVVVDAWNKNRRGLRVSISPVVSNGNGSPHSLVDTSGPPCELAKTNQQGGFTFPQIQLPPRLPPGLRPPGGNGGHPGGGGGSEPPVGVMPTVPGGVTPPIATLPPVGVMPTVPGGVTPPIGTLPPSGVTPGVPGGVTPPIATLPPSGVTPGAPSGVTPPIATLPPQSGTTTTRSAPEDNSFGVASITPGRKFALSPEWNVWVDSRGSSSADRRHELDVNGTFLNTTIGADKRVREDLVAGLMVILEKTRSGGFDGDLHYDSSGFSIGPYLAYRLSREWTFDASFSLGRTENEQRIVGLTGRYATYKSALSLSVTGDYALGESRLYPKLQISHSHFRNEAYELSGSIGGTPIAVSMEKDSFKYGVAESTVELNRAFRVGGGMLVIPFAELGARYEYQRPNDGQIVSGSLTMESTSPWAGSLRAGVRSLLTPKMFLEAGVGYLSLGQKDLDVWEGRLFLSFALD